MKTYRDFFTDVLTELNITVTTKTLWALYAVATLEGMNDRFNPLNSVVPYGNSVDFNSVHVQDYKTYDNGVHGTVQLLLGSPWRNVVQAMRNKESSGAILSAFSAVYATWGSHPNFPANHALGGEVMPGQVAPKPAKTKPVKTKPPMRVTSPAGARKYKVVNGDSLYSIAVKVWGKSMAGHWPDIAAANKIQKPYTIYPNEVLVIPPK